MTYFLVGLAIFAAIEYLLRKRLRRKRAIRVSSPSARGGSDIQRGLLAEAPLKPLETNHRALLLRGVLAFLDDAAKADSHKAKALKTALAGISDFIANEGLLAALKESRRRTPRQTQTRFEKVIQLWNSGFYAYHSLSADRSIYVGRYGPSAASLDAALQAVEEQFPSHRFTRPNQPANDLRTPTESKFRSSPTGLGFNSNDGLFLRPFKPWLKPEWRPKLRA